MLPCIFLQHYVNRRFWISRPTSAWSGRTRTKRAPNLRCRFHLTSGEHPHSTPSRRLRATYRSNVVRCTASSFSATTWYGDGGRTVQGAPHKRPRKKRRKADGSETARRKIIYVKNNHNPSSSSSSKLRSPKSDAAFVTSPGRVSHSQPLPAIPAPPHHPSRRIRPINPASSFSTTPALSKR